MTNKPSKKIELFPYNPAWPRMFEIEADDIRRFLGEHVHEIHHMGSTSVPGLTSKQDLDILLIVDDLKSSLSLEEYGFVFKGEINIPLRYFFSKNTERSKVNLHVVENDHGFIHLNLTFRDYLRTHSEVRDAYAQLKKEIIKDESSGERIQNMMPRYTYDKNQFIRHVLSLAGYEGTTVNFCFHLTEWDAYHRIRREQIYEPMGLTYDIHDPVYSAENHFHIVMYLGTTIVAAVHAAGVGDTLVIKELVMDKLMETQGLRKQLRETLKKWASNKGLRIRE